MRKLVVLIVVVLLLFTLAAPAYARPITVTLKIKDPYIVRSVEAGSSIVCTVQYIKRGKAVATCLIDG